MSKLFAALILITFFGCNGKTGRRTGDSIKSNYSKKSVDSLIKTGAINADDINEPASQTEERERLSKTYNDVKIIDSIFIINGDSIKFRLKYYCLENVKLVIPKHYDMESKPPLDFETHPFAMDILVINSRDTVLNKQFIPSDFNPFFKDPFVGNLKKYGSILDPELYKMNKDKNHIVIDLSFSIPSTDLGIAMSLKIDKTGAYKIKGPSA